MNVFVWLGGAVRNRLRMNGEKKIFTNKQIDC